MEAVALGGGVQTWAFTGVVLIVIHVQDDVIAGGDRAEVPIAWQGDADSVGPGNDCLRHGHDERERRIQNDARVRRRRDSGEFPDQGRAHRGRPLDTQRLDDSGDLQAKVDPSRDTMHFEPGPPAGKALRGIDEDVHRGRVQQRNVRHIDDQKRRIIGHRRFDQRPEPSVALRLDDTGHRHHDGFGADVDSPGELIKRARHVASRVCSKPERR